MYSIHVQARYVLQVVGCLNLSKPLRQENVKKIGTEGRRLRVINGELYCCTPYSIEVHSQDLQLQRSITLSSVRGFWDVAERDKDHVFVAANDGLFVFTKSGKISLHLHPNKHNISCIGCLI